ncbi:4034_t:CDS:2, partial [Scutellospora calospora]
IQVKNGTAKDDLYGKLFFYLHALELSQKLKMKRFDRIYVSNICDEIYSGIKPVLTKFRPLLNEKNPNSTLITLLMNWLPSIPDKFFKDTLSKKHYEKNTSSSLQQTFNSILTIANNTENEINASYIHTNEFKKYMEKMNVNTTAKKVGL